MEAQCRWCQLARGTTHQVRRRAAMVRTSPGRGRRWVDRRVDLALLVLHGPLFLGVGEDPARVVRALDDLEPGLDPVSEVGAGAVLSSKP